MANVYVDASSQLLTRRLKSLRILALLSLFFSLCLISLGGLVHNTGSSLACPDWPLCFGQVFPKMEGGVLIEHSHRLLGTLVGFCCIIMTLLAWPTPFKSHVLSLLGLVLLQGILGGVTVLLKISPLISTAHLGTSQIFIGSLAFLVFRTLNGALPSTPALESFSTRWLKFLRLSLVVLFLQILVGASIRHTWAGAACGVGREGAVFCMDFNTGGWTFWPTELSAKFNLLHRFLGFSLIFLLVFSTIPIIRWARKHKIKAFRINCVSIHTLVSFQVLIGVWSLYSGLGVAPVTLHLLFASLLWLSLLFLYFQCQKMFFFKEGVQN